MPVCIEFVAPDGTRRQVQGTEGASVMRSAVDAGIEGIVADCGGMLTCATCHVVVLPPWDEKLPPPGSDEQAMLEMTAAPREAGSRLSCQLALTRELDGLTVRLPPTQY